LDAGEGLLERDGEVVAEVVAAGGVPGRAAAEAPSEEGVEDVAEAEVLEPGEARRPLADPGVPEHVVAAPLLGVRQHAVGLAGLLEALGRLGIVGVAVRVVLHRQLAEGALQLVRAAVAADAEDLVVVALDGHSAAHAGGLATLTRAGRST